MSFIDDIVSFGKSALGFVGGDSVGGSIARTALLGWGLNKAQDWLNSENKSPEEKRRDYGVREQVDPNTDFNVPVIYGEAFTGGVVSDARLVNNNQTMWYCVTICEKTGIKLSDGQDSELEFLEVYWNTSKIEFKADGITANALVDEDGNRSEDISGLVKIYPYVDGSDNPTTVGSTGTTTTAAYNLFPEWTADHTMDKLVFALVRVDYNASKNITGLGTLEFRIKNSMVLPGDVLDDYLQNERYGCGIKEEDIFEQ